MDMKVFKGWEPKGRGQWSFFRVEKKDQLYGTKKQQVSSEKALRTKHKSFATV